MNHERGELGSAPAARYPDPRLLMCIENLQVVERFSETLLLPSGARDVIAGFVASGLVEGAVVEEYCRGAKVGAEELEEAAEDAQVPAVGIGVVAMEPWIRDDDHRADGEAFRVEGRLGQVLPSLESPFVLPELDEIFGTK